MYGKVVLKIDDNEYFLGADFSYSLLLQYNRIANNAVFIPKVVFEEFGMYDTHLISRRSCDWDLWIRFSSYVSFYFCDTIVSIVNAIR